MKSSQPTSRRNILPLVAPLLLVLLSSDVQAVTIGFESSEGYSLGLLTGQPTGGPPFWSNSAGFNVVGGAGVGGTNGAQSPSSLNATGLARFVPTASQLGGSNAASGQYSYSFSLTLNGNPNGTVSETAARFELFGTGSAQPIELRLMANGRLRFDNGSGLQNAKQTGDNVINMTSGSTATFSGVINFDTSTYTLFINGFQQTQDATFGSGQNNISFSDAGSYPNAGGFEAEFINTSTSRQVTIDNISLQVIPEPSASALVFAAGAISWAMRRERSSVAG